MMRRPYANGAQSEDMAGWCFAIHWALKVQKR